MNKIILLGLFVALPLLESCGLSPDGWRSSIAKEPTTTVCAYTVDDGLLSGAKKQAAIDEIDKRKATCDTKFAKEVLKHQKIDQCMIDMQKDYYDYQHPRLHWIPDTETAKSWCEFMHK